MLNRNEAMELLEWAHACNPGPWREHSLHAARAAEAIAEKAGLDPERAWISGALHDVGRFEGVRAMHHIIAGYNLLMEKGQPELARICMTHSFPGGDPMSYIGQWDVTGDERAFVMEYIAGCEFDDYDRLIQLCDALALPQGICLIEKRLVSVVLRHGVNTSLQGKWQATFDIQKDFENRMGCGLYSLFDDVIVNTFGLDFVSLTRCSNAYAHGKFARKMPFPTLFSPEIDSVFHINMRTIRLHGLKVNEIVRIFCFLHHLRHKL